MRKIRVGAIQPAYLPTPPQFNCTAKDFSADPLEVFESYLKPYINVTLNLLRRSGEEGCDIVTTCEDLCGTSNYGFRTDSLNIFPQLLDLTTGYAEKMIGEIAATYHMYIIACYNKRECGKNYNCAVIFNRSGEICYEYRKTHLPPYEMWQVEAGKEIGVCTLDFGKVGLCICYDMMFPEMCQTLSCQGAEIVFHPTLGYGWYDSIGEATLRTRANDGDFYLVTSKNYIWNAAGHSCIIDYWGQILADAGFYPNAIVTQEIDLDVPKTQPEWYFPSQTSGFCELHPRKMLERQPELYYILSESSPKLPIPDSTQQKELLQRIRNGKCHW